MLPLPLNLGMFLLKVVSVAMEVSMYMGKINAQEMTAREEGIARRP